MPARHPLCLRRLLPSPPRRAFNRPKVPSPANSSNSSRTEFHFTDATELRYSICFERHRLRRHSNPGKLSLQRFERRRQPHRLFPERLACHRPDAFSYGPQILQLFPNAGTNTGGDSVQIYGYGFGSDPTKIAVKIGGANAAVQKVENVTTSLLPQPRLQLPIFTRTHYPADASRLFRQSGRFVSSVAGSRRPPNHFSICKAFIRIAGRIFHLPALRSGPQQII